MFLGVSLNAASQTATTWDEGQKMDAIRKAYQRAIQIPMDNVKRLWEEYQEFENNLNKITVSGAPFAVCYSHCAQMHYFYRRRS